MKTLWNIIAILAVLNLLILVGVVTWLYQSQRLNRDRYEAVVALFKPTFAQQAQAQEEERKKEEAVRIEQENIAHLKQVEQGPVTIFDRLSTEQQIDELAMHKMARLQKEITELRQGLESQNKQLAMERQKLTEDRKAYEDYHIQRQAMLQSEDFRRAVDTLEQIKAPQAKQMMQELASRGKLDEVIEYLAAMDLRKSAAVLREYKTPAEIVDAAVLIEKLRLRRAQTASTNTEPGSKG